MPATKTAAISKPAPSQRAMRDCLRTAHGPPKVERLGEEIMHSFNSLVRDRRPNRMALCGPRALVGRTAMGRIAI
jgi:hypothetical protein